MREAEGMMIGNKNNNKNNNNTTSINKNCTNDKGQVRTHARTGSMQKHNGNVQFLLYINRKII
jgi:hypothetical protein